MDSRWIGLLSHKIRRWVRKHTAEAAAEDLTQATLMVLIEKGPREEIAEADLERWAGQVARHQLGNHIKAHRRESSRRVVLEDTRDFVSPTASPYEYLAAQELDAAITRACARMASGSQRAIIKLLRGGATAEEIREALPIPTLAKTRKKIYEARERLRTLLKQEGYTV